MNSGLFSLAGYVLIELILLYLLSRKLTQTLFLTVYLLTKSRSMAVSLLSILFFPGTVIHELSHLFMAEILGVRTGGFSLVPEAIEKKQVRTGSVFISQTDPFRRATIGLSPIFVGLAALSVIAYFLSPANQDSLCFLFSQPCRHPNIITVVLFYLLFAIGNTMFASPEDMEGVVPVVIVVSLLVAAAYVAGFRVTLPEQAIGGVAVFVSSLVANLGLVVGLNIVLLGLAKLLTLGVEKLTRRRFIGLKK